MASQSDGSDDVSQSLEKDCPGLCSLDQNGSVKQVDQNIRSKVSQTQDENDANGIVNSKNRRSYKKRKNCRKKPKRNMTAYNFFFREERQKIIEEGLERKNKIIAEENSRHQAESNGIDNLRSKEINNNANGILTKSSLLEGSDGEGNTQIVGSRKRKRKKEPHYQVSFEALGKTIAKRWKEVEKEDLDRFKKFAEIDLKRYQMEREVYIKAEKSDKIKEKESLENKQDEGPIENPSISELKRKNGTNCEPGPSIEGYNAPQASLSLQQMQQLYMTLANPPAVPPALVSSVPSFVPYVMPPAMPNIVQPAAVSPMFQLTSPLNIQPTMSHSIPCNTPPNLSHIFPQNVPQVQPSTGSVPLFGDPSQQSLWDLYLQNSFSQLQNLLNNQLTSPSNSGNLHRHPSNFHSQPVSTESALHNNMPLSDSQRSILNQTEQNMPATNMTAVNSTHENPSSIRSNFLQVTPNEVLSQNNSSQINSSMLFAPQDASTTVLGGHINRNHTHASQAEVSNQRINQNGRFDSSNNK